MSVYPDSSFLVSLYIRDIHSPQAIGRMASKPCPWITPLHRAEFAHAVERQVLQKFLSRRVALEVHAQFEKDCAEGVWAAVALPEHALDLCVVRLALTLEVEIGNAQLVQRQDRVLREQGRS